MPDFVRLFNVTSEFQEQDWNRLRRIQSGKCTPFLGAGACDGALPLGADVELSKLAKSRGNDEKWLVEQIAEATKVFSRYLGFAHVN